jgi:hypothetical protein
MYITIIFWTMILVPMLLYQNWFSKPHQFSNLCTMMEKGCVKSSSSKLACSGLGWTSKLC